MGLNKRYLSKKIISDYAKTHTYLEFKKMMFNSEILVFMDEESSTLYENFVKTNSENQQTLYETQKYQ